MRTKSIIQASAQIIRITSLTPGDVVKVIQKDYNEKKIFFGTILDVLNDGDQTFVTIALFQRNYGRIEGKVLVASGDEDIAIFPATVDEARMELQSLYDYTLREIEREEQQLADKKAALNRAKDFLSGTLSENVRDASFQVYSQDEYKQLKAAEPKDA